MEKRLFLKKLLFGIPLLYFMPNLLLKEKYFKRVYVDPRTNRKIFNFQKRENDATEGDVILTKEGEGKLQREGDYLVAYIKKNGIFKSKIYIPLDIMSENGPPIDLHLGVIS